MIYIISLDTQRHCNNVILFHLRLVLVHNRMRSYLKNSIGLGIYRNFHIFQEPFFSCSLALPLFYTIGGQPLIFFSTLTISSSTSLLVYSLTTQYLLLQPTLSPIYFYTYFTVFQPTLPTFIDPPFHGTTLNILYTPFYVQRSQHTCY